MKIVNLGTNQSIQSGVTQTLGKNSKLGELLSQLKKEVRTDVDLLDSPIAYYNRIQLKPLNVEDDLQKFNLTEICNKTDYTKTRFDDIQDDIGMEKQNKLFNAYLRQF